jgi:hypothetical protein
MCLLRTHLAATSSVLSTQLLAASAAAAAAACAVCCSPEATRCTLLHPCEPPAAVVVSLHRILLRLLWVGTVRLLCCLSVILLVQEVDGSRQ